MNVSLWNEGGNELVRYAVLQVNYAPLYFGFVLLILLPLFLFLQAFLLTVGRCSSSEPWVCVSVSIYLHLSEESKLIPEYSVADCKSKTCKEIPLLLL